MPCRFLETRAPPKWRVNWRQRRRTPPYLPPSCDCWPRWGPGGIPRRLSPTSNAEEFFLRAAATRALGELGSAQDLPHLVEKLNDPSAWVRMAAARGIYRIGGKAGCWGAEPGR